MCFPVPPPGGLSDRNALNSEKHPLGIKPAAVARDGSVLPDHAVAGDDDGEGIFADSHSHGAHSLRAPDPAGKIAVAHRLAPGNVEKRVPDILLEIGSEKEKRKLERTALPFPVFAKLRLRAVEERIRAIFIRPLQKPINPLLDARAMPARLPVAEGELSVNRAEKERAAGKREFAR